MRKNTSSCTHGKLTDPFYWPCRRNSIYFRREKLIVFLIKRLRYTLSQFVIVYIKGYWKQKFLLSYLNEHLKLFLTVCYKFFITCLILEIFSLKATKCLPSGIVEYMHVTSQVGSSKVFFTASDQYEPKTRF